MQEISWDDAKAASSQLIAQAVPFCGELYDSFARRQGVYVLVYDGDQLGGALWGEVRPQIVYQGHIGEDSRRHWDNNTGVSTLRRSLSALLAGSLHLLPAPNPQAEGEDRFHNYRLDETSELILTAWMKENLRLAFLDLEPEQVEPWYRGLLEFNSPMLVLRNNPNNSYGPQIKLYRAQMAEQAAQL